MPEAAKIKSRVEGKEPTEFTKDLRTAINTAVMEVLNTNNLTVRAQVIKNLESLGWRFKKESYRVAVEKNNMELVTVNFFTKVLDGFTPVEGEGQAAEAVEDTTVGDGPEVVDEVAPAISDEFDQ